MPFLGAFRRRPLIFGSSASSWTTCESSANNCVFLRFITSWYSCCCTYPSFWYARFYTFPRFWYAGFYTFPRFWYARFYTFPRIRQCFSQRILSFLMFFTLISAVCRLDGGSFIGSFWICKTWVLNHFFSACAKFFLFLSLTSLTFSLFKYLNVWWWGIYLSCIAW